MSQINFFEVEQVNYRAIKEKKISIILTTFREEPKFEMLFESLSRQSIKNFELVISDLLYDKRVKLIQNLAKKYGVPTVHCSRDTKGACRAFNIGIVNSSGDYLLHIDDCTYVPYRWVEKHMLTCLHNFLSLGSRYFTYSTRFPVEKYLTAYIEFPKRQNAKIRKRIEENSNGIKEYLFLHFGSQRVVSPQDFRLLGLPKELFMRDNLIMEAMPGWSYGGNLAAPTKLFLEINGFDEEYDNGYGWPDCDLGVRLFNKGHKSYINLSNWTLQVSDKEHVNIFDVMPELSTKKASEHNWKLYEEACEQRKTWANPKVNLKEERKKILESRGK